MSYGDLGQQATSRSRPTSSLAVGCSIQQRSYILTPDCLTRASVSPCARKLRTRAEFSTGGGNIILRREIRSSETQKVKKPRCLEGGAAGGEVEFSQQGACLSSIVLHAELRRLPANRSKIGQGGWRKGFPSWPRLVPRRECRGFGAANHVQRYSVTDPP